MTARARVSQAEMERAIRAARAQGGRAVEVEGGVLRIVFDELQVNVGSPAPNPADLLEE